MQEGDRLPPKKPPNSKTKTTNNKQARYTNSSPLSSAKAKDSKYKKTTKAFSLEHFVLHS